MHGRSDFLHYLNVVRIVGAVFEHSNGHIVVCISMFGPLECGFRMWWFMKLYNVNLMLNCIDYGIRDMLVLRK